MKITYTLSFITLLYLASFQVLSNNITVSNISLEGLNEVNNTVLVEFDLSWENSWRVSAGPSNWDAAWVFVKYRANNGTWNHANINVASPGGSGATVEVTSDEVGAMVYRDSDGNGDINFTDLQLQWDYSENGVETSDVLDIQVFAIEMVYVPEGSFWLGGATGDEVNKFYEGGFGNTNVSYEVTSENEIFIFNSVGNLYYNNENGNAGDQTGSLSTDFPKGFAAFYCMKYEASEGQWVAFFNTLTAIQKSNLDLTGPDGKDTDDVLFRNTISWNDGSTSATTSIPDQVLNWISPTLQNAYLDWAGLRPMTELEYEKACRGPVLPKAGEFAWGNANIMSDRYSLTNEETIAEIISNPGEGVGNANYVSTNPFPGGNSTSPLRAGLFAASAVNKNREETGGSYYGIMELSGSVLERCIFIGNTAGRNFAGLHGNGILTTSGFSNVGFWPSSNGDGYSLRGGFFLSSPNELRVSERLDIDQNSAAIGIRGVRSMD